MTIYGGPTVSRSQSRNDSSVSPGGLLALSLRTTPSLLSWVLSGVLSFARCGVTTTLRFWSIEHDAWAESGYILYGSGFSRFEFVGVGGLVGAGEMGYISAPSPLALP